MALVDDFPRMVRAEATMTTTVIVISREILPKNSQYLTLFIKPPLSTVSEGCLV